ncbi:MAG: biopolymer transporter ExbD [Deltaproteobacteria bacterium]|nr:biopolymer transporter ExbD [Deltaproteobacteria bacterium]
MLTETDQLFLNERPVNLKGLADHFTKAARTDRETQILIQADQRVAHGKVVQVMDLARSAGLARLAIVTQPKSKRDG